MSTALAKTDQHDARHPMLRQLDLFSSSGKDDGDGLDVSFLSRSLCISGLPLRHLTERGKPGSEATEFNRSDERFSLTIRTNPVILPGHRRITIGLPFGARARLLILWMTTEARKPGRSPGDRWLEIGRIESWMQQIGAVSHHENVQIVKDQLVRLSFCHFSIALSKEGLEFFSHDMLTDKVVFQQDDLEHYAAGELSKVRFPLGVELSMKAHQRFTSQDVVPISTEVLRKVATSAMSLDLVVYLSYRLPFIDRRESELVTWKKLALQFGNGEPKSRFRQLFDGAITKALDALACANVDVTDEGLVLKHSPIDVRKLFAVAPTGKPVATLKRVRSDTRIVTERDVGSVTSIMSKTA